MAINIRTVRYRCSDDCRMSGCPGHEGRLTHHSVSDGYSFNMDGRELEFERGELEAMLQLLRDLGRVDAIQVGKPVTRHPENEGERDGGG